MILSLCQWAQNTAFFTAIRGSWNVYPAIMAIHLLGIALFGGMILITDMRLLGLAMRSRSIADVVDQLRAPKRVGLLCRYMRHFDAGVQGRGVLLQYFLSHQVIAPLVRVPARHDFSELGVHERGDTRSRRENTR